MQKLAGAFYGVFSSEGDYIWVQAGWSMSVERLQMSLSLDMTLYLLIFVSSSLMKQKA